MVNKGYMSGNWPKTPKHWNLSLVVVQVPKEHGCCLQAHMGSGSKLPATSTAEAAMQLSENPKPLPLVTDDCG